MSAMRRGRLLAALLLASAIAGCGGGAETSLPQPGGTQPGVLSISAAPRLDPYPDTPDELYAVYDEANRLVQGAGARGRTVTYTWSALEPVPGRYDARALDDLRRVLAAAPGSGLTHFIGLQVVNGATKELPSDLMGRGFDDPVVQTRFRTLLDQVIGAYRGSIRYLSIGNEADLYLEAHPLERDAFVGFYTLASAYARALDPALAVGTTLRADAALGARAAELQSLVSRSDAVMLTYYPLQMDSGGRVSVRPSTVVATDFAGLRKFAGSKQIVFQELGYPASPLNASSEAAQAEFVRAVFRAWQSAEQQIVFLNFFQLHDFTAQHCKELVVYYGVAAPSFEAFLCSLGMRQVNGTPRAAWQALVSEAERAHFP